MILDLENDAIIAAEKLRPLIPHLPTETLVDLVGAGNKYCVFSIASAENLPFSVCASLAETADQDILLQLLKNKNTEILDFSFLRIIERYEENSSILVALENRNDLSPPVWWELLLARLKLIYPMIGSVDYDNVIDRTDEAIIALLWASPTTVREAYLVALDYYSALTPSLIIQSLNSGAFDVAIALLSKTSLIDKKNIAQLFYDENREQIRSLALKIRIPEIILNDFMNAAEEIIRFNNNKLSRAA